MNSEQSGGVETREILPEMTTPMLRWPLYQELGLNIEHALWLNTVCNSQKTCITRANLYFTCRKAEKQQELIISSYRHFFECLYGHRSNTVRLVLVRLVSVITIFAPALCLEGPAANSKAHDEPDEGYSSEDAEG